MQSKIKLYKDLGIKDFYNSEPINRTIKNNKEVVKSELDLCNSLDELKKLVEGFDGCDLKK